MYEKFEHISSYNDRKQGTTNNFEFNFSFLTSLTTKPYEYRQTETVFSHFYFHTHFHLHSHTDVKRRQQTSTQTYQREHQHKQEQPKQPNLMTYPMSVRAAKAANTHKWQRGEHYQQGSQRETKFQLITCSQCPDKFHHYYDLNGMDFMKSAVMFAINMVCEGATMECRDIASQAHDDIVKADNAQRELELLDNNRNKKKKRSRSPTSNSRSRSRSPKRLAPTSIPMSALDSIAVASTGLPSLLSLQSESLSAASEMVSNQDCVLPTIAEVLIRSKTVEEERVQAVLRFVRYKLRKGDFEMNDDTEEVIIVIDPSDAVFKTMHYGPLTTDTLTRAFGSHFSHMDDEATINRRSQTLRHNLNNWKIQWRLIMHCSLKTSDSVSWQMEDFSVPACISKNITQDVRVTLAEVKEEAKGNAECDV